MDQGVQPKAPAPTDKADKADQPVTADKPVAADQPADVEPAVDAAAHARDERITRVVHIALGVVIAALGGWLLYRSRTELAFRGPNGEPGPGYLPVLLTSCLIVLGLLLAAIWT